MERKIPLRRVVGKAKATEIDEIITSQHPDLHRGDKTYPGIYQQAVTEYMTNMSDEETQEMQELLEEWQAEGPPLDVRLKWVSLLRLFTEPG
jgi:signal recognition particle subunit SEC65